MSVNVFNKDVQGDEALYRGRANDGDSFLVGHLYHLPSQSFGDALGYDGDGVNLKTQLNKLGPLWKILVEAQHTVQSLFIPVGTAWLPLCCQRQSAAKQSWSGRLPRGASSWHRPCSYRPAAGSLCGPSKTSACDLRWATNRNISAKYEELFETQQ